MCISATGCFMHVDIGRCITWHVKYTCVGETDTIRGCYIRHVICGNHLAELTVKSECLWMALYVRLHHMKIPS